MDQESINLELASYVGKLLRDSFGRGPGSVFVTIDNFIITIYFRNFLSPTENILISQKQQTLVQQTRDKLMQNLIPEIKAYVKILSGLVIKEFYYDWSLPNKSGLFVGICSTDENGEDIIDNDYDGKISIHKEISHISIEAEKEPEEILSYLLNDRTLIVIRKGILVRIEKELIRMGLNETLRIAKRKLEKGLLHNANRFESILNCRVSDIFVDWDFDLDKSAIVFILNPKK